MSVILTEIKNPFDLDKNEISQLDFALGKPINFYLPELSKNKDIDSTFVVAVNANIIDESDWDSFVVNDDDMISVCAEVGWETVAYVVIMVLAYVFMGPEEPPPLAPPNAAVNSVDVYSWGEVKPSEREGIPIPYLYGTFKVPGQVLNQFVTIDGDKETLHTLLGICDHEIDSITDVRINDQPYTYYRDVTVDTTQLGTLADTPIPGFTDIVYSSSVNAELLYNTPLTQQTDGNAVEKIHVFIAAKKGLYYSNDEGGYDQRTATFSVEYSIAGADDWTTHSNETMTAATHEIQRRKVTIDDLPANQYEVRVTRTNAKETALRGNSEIHFSSIQEVVKKELRYPGLAKYAINALATDQLSGGLPTYTCLASRDTVTVWDYDLGTPGPNPKRATNPAWILYDILVTHAGIDRDRLIWDDFSEWADYCDEDIDGDYRHEVNIYITQGTFATITKKIAALGNATIRRRGSDYGIFIDRAETVVSQLFSVGSVIKNSYSISYTPYKERANLVEIEYTDPDRDYSKQVVSVYTADYLSNTSTAKKAAISVEAGIDQKQAIRRAVRKMNYNRFSVRRIEFAAYTKSFACIVGDLFYWQSDVTDYDNGRIGGRILSAGNGAGDINPFVELDAPVVIAPGVTYAITVILSDGDVLVTDKIVTNSPSTASILTLSTPWVEIPAEEDEFIFGVSSNYNKIYRITSITRRDDNTRSIVGEEYIPEIYTNDADYVIEELLWEIRKQKAIQVFLAEFLSYNTDGSYSNNINVNWYRSLSEIIASWAVWIQDLSVAIEPAETNMISPSEYRTFSLWNGAAPVTQDQIGVDGEVNRASTLEDTLGTYEQRNITTVVSADASWYTFGIFIKLDSTATSYFPAVSLALTGGTGLNQAVFVDLTDGTISSPSGYDDGDSSVTVISDDWIYVTVSLQNNSTNNSLFKQILPAGSADGNNWSAAATGETVFDYAILSATETSLVGFSAFAPVLAGYVDQNSFQITQNIINFRTYRVFVVPRGEGPVASEDNTQTITVLGQLAPPADVINFSGSWDSIKRQVHFVWTANSEIDIASYEIRSGASWAAGTVVAATQNNYVSIFIDEGTSEAIVYRIKAIDATGIYSETEATDSIGVDTTDCPLVVPTGLAWSSSSVIASDGRNIVLMLITWTDSSGDSNDWTAFELELLDNVTSQTSNYMTQNASFQVEVIPNRSYSVRVRSRDVSNNVTAWSANITHTSTQDTTAPDAPTALSATGTFTQILLDWTHGAEYDLSHFLVYRHTSNVSGSATLIGTASRSLTAASGNYVDTPPTDDVYYYWVRSVDTSNNESALSAVASDNAPGVTATIGPGTITDVELADGAVTGVKIAALAVDTGNLALLAVEAGQIAANAVIADKIISNAVTSDKINANAVTTVKIDAGAVTADEIGANAIVAGKIAANAVSTNTIEAGAIISEKINAGAVGADEIAAGAVTATKIDVTDLAAINVDAGTLTGGVFQSTTLNADNDPVLEVSADLGKIEIRDDTTRVVFDSGDITFYKTFSGTEIAYKSLKRVPEGFASHGDDVEVGYFSSQPTIVLQPLNMMSYSEGDSNVDQFFDNQSINLREVDPSTGSDDPGSSYWAFEVSSQLISGAGTGFQAVGRTETSASDPGWIVIDETDTATMTTPANVTDVEVDVTIKSVRGTGTGGVYYNREATLRLYAGASLEATKVITTELAGQLSAINSTISATGLTAGSHDLTVQCFFDNDSGTFGSGSYEYGDDDANSSPNQTALAEGAIGWGQEFPDSDSETVNFPQPTVPGGWTVYSVDYDINYDYSLTSVIGAGASPGTTCYVTSTFFSVYHSLTGTNSSGGATNQTASVNTSSLSLNFTIQAWGGAHVGSGPDFWAGTEAEITCNTLTVTAYYRRLATGSTTPDNELRVVEYTYDVASGSQISAGDVKWTATGE